MLVTRGGVLFFLSDDLQPNNARPWGDIFSDESPQIDHVSRGRPGWDIGFMNPLFGQLACTKEISPGCRTDKRI